MFHAKTAEAVVNGAAQALKYVYAFNMDTQEIIVIDFVVLVVSNQQRSWFSWHKCVTQMLSARNVVIVVLLWLHQMDVSLGYNAQEC